MPALQLQLIEIEIEITQTSGLREYKPGMHGKPIICLASPLLSLSPLWPLLSPMSSQVRSYSPLGTKAPGYKERQTRGNAISERGGLCMCLRALSGGPPYSTQLSQAI
jgi:hypothetical protein